MEGIIVIQHTALDDEWGSCVPDGQPRLFCILHRHKQWLFADHRSSPPRCQSHSPGLLDAAVRYGKESPYSFNRVWHYDRQPYVVMIHPHADHRTYTTGYQQISPCRAAPRRRWILPGPQITLKSETSESTIVERDWTSFGPCDSIYTLR